MMFVKNLARNCNYGRSSDQLQCIKKSRPRTSDLRERSYCSVDLNFSRSTYNTVRVCCSAILRFQSQDVCKKLDINCNRGRSGDRLQCTKKSRSWTSNLREQRSSCSVYLNFSSSTISTARGCEEVLIELPLPECATRTFTEIATMEEAVIDCNALRNWRS